MSIAVRRQTTFLKASHLARAEPYLFPPLSWFLACVLLQQWRWRRHVPPKRRLTLAIRCYIPEDRNIPTLEY
jgi:hypothetical protein